MNNNKQCKARAFGADELNFLRDFLEELDVIPLSALPPEVWPLVYEHALKVTADDFEPKSVEKDFYVKLNENLRKRKKIREEKQNELLPFNF